MTNAIDKWREFWCEECGPVSLRWGLASLLEAPLPAGAMGRLRTRLYRGAGMKIGRGTVVLGPIRLRGGAGRVGRLTVGRDCFFNDGLYFDAAAPIRIGDGVSLGMDCLFTTVGHAVGAPGFRAGERSARPITIGDGVWLAARVTVLPGITVGPGTIVGAGAVVTRDLPAHVFAAGVPAKTVRSLEGGQSDEV